LIDVPVDLIDCNQDPPPDPNTAELAVRHLPLKRRWCDPQHPGGFIDRQKPDDFLWRGGVLGLPAVIESMYMTRRSGVRSQQLRLVVTRICDGVLRRISAPDLSQRIDPGVWDRAFALGSQHSVRGDHNPLRICHPPIQQEPPRRVCRTRGPSTPIARLKGP
jgi:hypothetical protein